jgi:hypothetical protein
LFVVTSFRTLLPLRQMKEYKEVFASFDTDNSGTIDGKELASALKNLKMYTSAKQVEDLMKEVDKDGNGTIEFNEFLDIVINIKSGKASGGGFGRVYSKQKELIQVKGHSGTHSFSQEEMDAFSEHLNNCLSGDSELKHLLPIQEGKTDLCTKVRDGLLLAKFINLAVKDTIDERALNKPKGGKELSLFQIQENQTLVISSAKGIGVQTVNLGTSLCVCGD